jgi:hypothetical protein
VIGIPRRLLLVAMRAHVAALERQRHLQSLNRKFTIRNRIARVAKLADAPDLGLRNRRFQNAPFRFKKQSIYERKTRYLTNSVASTTGE